MRPARPARRGTDRVDGVLPVPQRGRVEPACTRSTPKDHLRADRDAEAKGLEIIGVMHSHTHTDAYPSPTDVAQAPDPAWHYVIVSLRQEAPVLRSYRIVDEAITEEQVSRRTADRRIPTDLVDFPGASRVAVYDSVLDLIGNTPIVDISALSPNPTVRILAKLEGQNPGGSVKDRAAK